MIACIVLYLLTKAIFHRFFHPLSGYPGPFWASITTLWYFRSVRCGVEENLSTPLHNKYGLFVRVAPNILSIADAKEIDTVYGPHGDKTLTKTDFYDGLASHISARRDVFSERDETKAAERRRLVASLYSQSAILDYEPAMEAVTGDLEERMAAFAESGEVFDISVWLHKYGFDIVGSLFFGREGGFGNVKYGSDYNGWFRAMETMPNVGASSTYMPSMLRPFSMVMELLVGGKDARDGVLGLNKVIVDAKIAARERSEAMSAKKYSGSGTDILSKLIAMANGPEFGLPDAATEVWTSIWAGGDTTGTTLTAALYFLQRNPEVLRRLQDELDDAYSTGKLSHPIQYTDAVKLPFLHAVMQETMRLHPVIGIGLPRSVPIDGAELCGQWVIGGPTIVMNPNVIQKDRSVFGEDAEDFRPERWLVDTKHPAHMSRHMLAFGYGRRVCLGRHIARTEMYKVLPTLLLNFRFELEDPELEWKVNRGFSQGQKGVRMRVYERI